MKKYKGTCQVCGRVQAITKSGVIANHGYKVEWNMHLGSCQGSGYPALEVSEERALQIVGVYLEKEAQHKKRAVDLNLFTAASVANGSPRLSKKIQKFGKAEWTLDEVRAFLLENVEGMAENANRLNFWIEDIKEREAHAQLWIAKQIAAAREQLKERIATIHGQPLKERS